MSASTAPYPLKVEPFDVVTKWVRVEVSILADHVANFADWSDSMFREPGDSAHSRLWSAVEALRNSPGPFPPREAMVEWIDQHAEYFRDYEGEATAAMTLTMKQRDWEDFDFVADCLSLPIEIILRAALYKEHGRTCHMRLAAERSEKARATRKAKRGGATA